MVRCAFVFLFVSTLFACNRNEDSVLLIEPEVSLNCADFMIALESLDDESLQSMLDPELENFTLLDLDNDACPYTRNLDGIAEFLNSLCEELVVSVFCCVCVQTFPSESEISVSFDFDGEEVVRIIDLASPLVEGGPLTFSGVHE